MSDLKKIEGEVTLKAKQLAALRIDATNIEAVKQLKGLFFIAFRIFLITSPNYM